jgi:16S rRNA (uracil1498-N3)-methyltransferase
MRNTRVYVEMELAPGRELLLPAGPSAHLLRVLRLKPGATLVLFDGRGGEYQAELLAGARSEARVRTGEHDPEDRESPLHTTLLQGVARGERMDTVIQKATELGVSRIVPVSSEFSVVRLDAATLERRLAHWRAVAVAACEQCGRNRLPVIEPLAGFDAACQAGAARAGLLALLAGQAPGTLPALVAGSPVPPSAAQILVGPEGGFSGREQLVAQRAGYVPCRLGPRVLRTETAGPAAIAVLQSIAGDLRGRGG